MEQIKVKDFDIYVGNDGRIFVEKNGIPYSNVRGDELTKAFINEINQLQGLVDKAVTHFKIIAAIGGNLPDERFNKTGGPNDARYRGQMYCDARSFAREAIEALTKEHYESL